MVILMLSTTFQQIVKNFYLNVLTLHTLVEDFQTFTTSLNFRTATFLLKYDLRQSGIEFFSSDTNKTRKFLLGVVFPIYILAMTSLIVNTVRPDLVSCDHNFSAWPIKMSKWIMNIWWFLWWWAATPVCSRVTILIIACVCAATLHSPSPLWQSYILSCRCSNAPQHASSLRLGLPPFIIPSPPFAWAFLPSSFPLAKMRSGKTMWPLVSSHYLDDACSAVHLQLSRRHAHTYTQTNTYNYKQTHTNRQTNIYKQT